MDLSKEVDGADLLNWLVSSEAECLVEFQDDIHSANQLGIAVFNMPLVEKIKKPSNELVYYIIKCGYNYIPLIQRQLTDQEAIAAYSLHGLNAIKVIDHSGKKVFLKSVLDEINSFGFFCEVLRMIRGWDEVRFCLEYMVDRLERETLVAKQSDIQYILLNYQSYTSPKIILWLKMKYSI